MAPSAAIEPDAQLDDDLRGDVLVVIASFNQQHHAGPTHLRRIKRLARNFNAVGGIEAGSWILARSGLLEGRAATTHWEDFEDFANSFPRIEVKPDRYVIDGKVFTTGGASPTSTHTEAPPPPPTTAITTPIMPVKRSPAGFAWRVSRVGRMCQNPKSSDVHPAATSGEFRRTSMPNTMPRNSISS